MGPTTIQRFVSRCVKAYVNGLPAWPGKWRLLQPLSRLLVAEVKPGVWIYVNPRSVIEGSYLTEKRRYDSTELDFFWDVLKEGMAVIDVGAFMGAMALVAAARVGSLGRVIAFEAGSSSVHRLYCNRRLNSATNLTICAFAAGARSGVLDYVPSEESPDQSVTRPVEGAGDGSIVVRVVSIDECVRDLGIAEVDLLKIDVEGAEPAVIAGAYELLSPDKCPMLVFEINIGALDAAGQSAKQLVDQVLQLGFELFVIEVAKSRAYINALGVKPCHRERLRGIDRYTSSPLLDHEWYRERVAAHDDADHGRVSE